MRIALLSDVHVNLPAFDAVLADIDRRRADAVYHLGDLVGYAPRPNEVAERVAARGTVGVSLNTGSVGRPKDGDPRAGYTLLHLNAAAGRVEHVRVPYGFEETARGIVAAGLPGEFATHIRVGGTAA